ncbi:hypothetical protein [Rhizobium hidalgonense]|uniref:Uncharacterized protein n=1 Tax=Rhizobium hidalgonense TaxID=1538159 RepID=A0ABX4JP02_9HYPH|nr:hypothetical protein [Rhizobium hidalgonense]PDT21808.1 hypothetical protein CO674_19865 [Rhizobium hidalgonense]PON08464.1 hypothetical protein ATY29_05565 [Rhizobium hidalgonense]
MDFCGNAATVWPDRVFKAIRTGMAAADEISTNIGEATSYEDELEKGFDDLSDTAPYTLPRRDAMEGLPILARAPILILPAGASFRSASPTFPI